MAVDQRDWDRAIDILAGLGLMPMNTGTIGEVAQALTDARAEGYRDAVNDSRRLCSLAGGCLR